MWGHFVVTPFPTGVREAEKGEKALRRQFLRLCLAFKWQISSQSRLFYAFVGKMVMRTKKVAKKCQMFRNIFRNHLD